ncbi:MAG: rare lipoprotein [Proteobacteria bacterium]|nr:rare lipoprotein [Pseudomonadota bacterium]
MQDPGLSAPMRFRHSLLAAGAVALLAGCGSTATRDTAEPAAKPTAPKPAPQAKAAPRGGGYYLDDGPGDSAPPDLDKLPDPEPRAEPLNRFANNPYSVFGREYVPAKTLAPYRVRGVASWYGRKFHGQPTSSGERYDMYQLTAAHPTLPIPSYARVTNVANGRSVTVRVNDRGPFLRDRVIDLSYAAAYKLGYVEAGSALVEVETLMPGMTIAAAPRRQTLGDLAGGESRPRTDPGSSAAAQAGDTRLNGEAVVPLPPVTTDAGGVFLQLGAFSTRDNAEAFRQHVVRMLPWLEQPVALHPRDGLVRVHLGPYPDQIEALAVAERIREAVDWKPVIVVR